MGMTWRASCCAWLVALVATSGISGEARQRGEAHPQEPIAAIVEAFRTHDLVAVSDPHGNLQMQCFCGRPSPTRGSPTR